MAGAWRFGYAPFVLAAVEEASLPELIRGHRDLHTGLAEELRALAPEVFFAPQGEHWSPAQHVDHLIRSVRPLASALSLPRALLQLRFGRGDGSRPTAEVVGGYLERLAAGAGAQGRYLPDLAAAEAPATDRQQWLLTDYREVGDELERAIGRWRDDQLDRTRLPHPLLGLLTVREMVAWSLYHGRHHRQRVRERLGAAG